MSSPFVHLHAHSSYSLLDGLARIDDMLQTAKDAAMPALAITDHGTMFGAIEFYSKAKELGVKPIIGCEVYVSDRPLDEKPGPQAKNYHLILLAEDEIGYRNLIRLTTEAHLRGFYRKPRVEHALLERHSDGLICLSGCASGELARTILEGTADAALELADWHRQVFGDRYYLELQDHNLGFQKAINAGVLEISRKLGLPLVATNDAHYVRADQARAHEVLLCVQTQTTMSDPKRMRMETQEFYLKSAEQMQALFGHLDGAISNTLAIAERCNLELQFGRPHLPQFENPPGMTSEQHLRALCEDGLRRRYPDAGPEVWERLTYELSVISSTGFVDYFLLVHDVIHFARSRGIPVGPGRGSAAASLVAYCLFVTNVDPVKHGLSFERFLNPERVTMPDMDLDFADDRRDELIRYVTDKYGRDHVSQIITFGTMGVKAGVRDVGRVLGMPYPDVDRVAKLIPQMCAKVDKAKEEAPELQDLYENDATIRELLDLVQNLEGVARHASTHAAGVLISRDPLSEHVPLYKVPKNDGIVSQYAMGAIEKIGILKMDFLGLRTLTILDRVQKFVAETRGIDLDLDSISLEDPAIYALLRSGDTFGVFQVDKGMRNHVKNLQPTEFNHVVALNALYRPGPMQYIDLFCDRKNGRSPVAYKHPALEEVLKETYGVIVYQEQVMRMLNILAGFSLGEADLVRRAMAKKKADLLAQEKERFVERAVQRGMTAPLAEELFADIEPFAGYAFNKAHSAAYAMLTCQTAYLKATYPVEYLAGLLSAERDNAEKVSEAMAECARMGIGVFPPDVNASEVDFTIQDGKIRFGLCAVKNVGAGAVESIIAIRREGGPFTSIEDLCQRVDWSVVNKRVLESLVKCGALDSFGIERGRLVENLDRIASFAAQLQKQAASGQTSLFGDVLEAAPQLQLATADVATLDQKIAWEEELIGIAITQHPVIDAAARFHALGGVSVAEVGAERGEERLLFGGMIKKLRAFNTKAGQPMASFTLTDLRATLDAIVFSRSYDDVQSRLTEGTIVVADGRVDASDGGVRLVVSGLYLLEEAEASPPSISSRRSSRSSNGNGNGNGHGPDTESSPFDASHSTPVPAGPSRQIRVVVARSGDRAADLDRIERVYAALRRYDGGDDVELLAGLGPRVDKIPLPHGSVRICSALVGELTSLVGADHVLVDGAPATP
jgi:DNA polymerase III subunit alpha